MAKRMICDYALIAICFSTGAVSGSTPRQILNDSAACSTSMPQPITEFAALWSRAQTLKGVGLSPYDKS